MSKVIDVKTQKTKNSQRAVIISLFFIFALAGVVLQDIRSLEKKAQSMQTPDKLTEAVREESKQCLAEMTIIECAQQTKELEQKAEILSKEYKARKEAIDSLFSTYEETK